MTPEQIEALVETVRWMMWGGYRRAGALGQLVGFVGLDETGQPAELIRADVGWRVIVSGQATADFLPDEIIAAIGEGKFSPKKAKIRHDLPALLFHAAVTDAEESVTQLRRAASGSGLEGGTDEESAAAFEFVIVTSALDAAVRPAIASVILAVSTAEAQVNAWADGHGGWQPTDEGDEDRLDLVRKCKALAAKVGIKLDIGRDPYQALGAVVKRRNDYVHSKGAERVVDLVGSGAQPARAVSVEARQTCKTIRATLIHLAGAIGEDPPDYLAYCPPGDPADDSVWATAAIFTGARDDPDFPKVTDKLSGAVVDDPGMTSGGSPE